MNLLKTVTIAVIIASVMFTGTALADETAPSLPALFFGTAQTVSGEPIDAGTRITAVIDGEEFVFVVTEKGKIGTGGTFGDKFIISPSTTPKDNKIVFKIGEVAAKETATYSLGSSTYISLTFDVEQIAPTQTTIPEQPTSVPTESPVSVIATAVGLLGAAIAFSRK